jgi:hypothetical protein
MVVLRDCYVALADKVFDGITRIALVLGMKSIGKPLSHGREISRLK